MEFKYIIVTDGDREVPIIFSAMIVHADMYEVAKKLFKHCYPVSAGFVDMGFEVKAYGKSESMEIGSRAKDGEIISFHPYTHGMMEIHDYTVGLIKDSVPYKAGVREEVKDKLVYGSGFSTVMNDNIATAKDDFMRSVFGDKPPEDESNVDDWLGGKK